MEQMLDRNGVLMHPFVLGEIALGHLNPRSGILNALRKLPSAEAAEHEEVIQFIDRYRLFGVGLSYVDVHLLTAAALTFCAIWTRDKRFRAAAERLGLWAKGLD
jgi:hypothetical protein